MAFIFNKDGGDKKVVEDLVNIYVPSFNGRLTLIHNEKSLGMEAASNKGFDLASEEFLVVHDDDDSWTPQFLQKTTLFLKENMHAVAVITNCIVIHEEITNNCVLETLRYEWGYWQDNVDISILLKGNITPPICLLIRMDIAKSIGPFNEDLPVLGDWDYNLRLFRCGEILTLNEKLAFYHHRVNATSVYGNSVHAGVNKHKLYAFRYKNALARKALQESQGNYGVLQILLLEIERIHQQLIQSDQEIKKILNEKVTIYNRIRLFIRKLDIGKIKKLNNIRISHMIKI